MPTGRYPPRKLFAKPSFLNPHFYDLGTLVKFICLSTILVTVSELHHFTVISDVVSNGQGDNNAMHRHRVFEDGPVAPSMIIDVLTMEACHYLRLRTD